MLCESRTGTVNSTTQAHVQGDCNGSVPGRKNSTSRAPSGSAALRLCGSAEKRWGARAWVGKGISGSIVLANRNVTEVTGVLGLKPLARSRRPVPGAEGSGTEGEHRSSVLPLKGHARVSTRADAPAARRARQRRGATIHPRIPGETPRRGVSTMGFQTGSWHRGRTPEPAGRRPGGWRPPNSGDGPYSRFSSSLASSLIRSRLQDGSQTSST